MSAIVNSAAVNSRGKEFEYLFSILLGICPGGELSDRKVFLSVSTFSGHTKPFSAPFYIRVSVV